MNKENPKILNDFLNYLVIYKNYSMETIKGYNQDLLSFFKFLIKYLNLEIEIKDINVFILASVKESDIIAFLIYLNRERNNLAKTRNRKLSALKTFFKYLYSKYPNLKDKLNPAQNIDPAEEMIRLPKYLRLEDAKRLQSIFNVYNSRNCIRDNTIIILFLNCALRLSELANININDINFSQKTLNVIGKENKERTVYLNKVAIEAIKKYLLIRKNSNSAKALFLDNRNKRISIYNIEKICKRAFKLAGLEEYKYTVHSLRHTAATYIYKETKDILVVKEILGHERLDTTEIYTHIFNEDIKKAIDNNPLNKF